LTAAKYVFRCRLQRAKFSWNLPWDIQVTNHQKNHISERIQGAKPADSILHNLYDTINPFFDRIGESWLNLFSSKEI
jgi:hypothetical protein